MSDIVDQVREIQRFFPEASDPLIFSEGTIQIPHYDITLIKLYLKFSFE